MIKETVKFPRFSDTEFICLYCVMNFKNKLSPIIEHHKLEKELYKFYILPEFKEIFQGICPKRDHIYPENNYLNLGIAFNEAQLYGLLVPIHGVGETRSIISCDENLAQKIISRFDVEIVNKMAQLFDMMFELSNNTKNQESQISNAEEVMDNFMMKLDSDDLTCDTEQTVEMQIPFDEEFIGEQIESYQKVLTFIEKTQGSTLSKKRNRKHDK